MSLSDDESNHSSGDSLDNLENEPMYHILMQYLITEDGRNIAVCVDELTKEMRDIKVIFGKMASMMKHMLQLQSKSTTS